jgi:hypothetical protein
MTCKPQPTLKLSLVFCIIVVVQQLRYSAKIISINDQKNAIVDSGIPGLNSFISFSSLQNPTTQLNLRTILKPLFEAIPTGNGRQKVKPAVLKNIIRRKHLLDREDIVLATHVTTNKLKTLLTQLKYWNGPASAAVYIQSQKDIDSFINFRNENGQLLHDTSFHFVMEKTDMAYPHNTLRNVAMESVESDYFLALDVDFIPMPESCHEILVKTLKNKSSEFTKNRKRLFVLPAFQLFPAKNETHTNENMLPKSKEEFLKKIEKKEMSIFHADDFSAGHAATNYRRWQNNYLKQPPDNYFYDLKGKKLKFANFEPYVIAYKPGIPRYWEGKLLIFQKRRRRYGKVYFNTKVI